MAKIIHLLAPAAPDAAPVNHHGRPAAVEAWGVTDDGLVVALVREGLGLVAASAETDPAVVP